MTREEAVALRTRQLQGAYVEPQLLAEVIRVIAETNTPTTRGQYCKALGYRRGSKPAEPEPSGDAEMWRMAADAAAGGGKRC